MSRVLRQWWPVVLPGALFALLVGAGWLARERFMPVEVGSGARDFTAVDMEGRPVSLADLRGEVVFLNVWATWCPPCVEEMPSMQRLHEELGPQGLRIVALSIDAAQGRTGSGVRPGGNVRAFVEEHGLTFDIWHDPSGGIQRIYQTTGVPETIVIDRRGRIVKRVVGATDWDSEVNKELFRRLLES